MRRAGPLTFALLGLVLGLGAPLTQAETFVVTKTADTADGHCNSDCSLREAVGKANAHGGADRVKLEGRTYRLRLEGAENLNASGDLDVTGDLELIGAGSSASVVMGAWAANPEGLVEIMGSGTLLTAADLTLRDGDSTAVPRGAAIHINPDARLTLQRAKVVSNESALNGAISNYGDAVVSRVTFSHNTATCCSAFYNEPGGVAKLTNVTFDHNTASHDTGAMYESGDKATLRNVTFSDNSAGNIGGGAVISAGSGVFSLTNVTFSGNSTVGYGGGLYTEAGSTTNLNNVTFTENTADADAAGGGDGGGVYRSDGTINIRNTIVADNTDTGGEHDDCGQTSGDAFTSLGHNLIGPGPEGCVFALGPGDLVGAEATQGLAPLADNGGHTETVALRQSSPAIDNGSNDTPGSGGAACARTDQRGVSRPQGSRCDIGAFEREH
jgi:CSLREA domain-containing protein